MAQNALPDSSASLPSSLIDSYKQYKNDTDYFATWLANMGEKCGFRLSTSDQTTSQTPDPPAQKAGPRLKGKARQLARDAEEADSKLVATTLLVRDFIPLANRIAHFKKPRVLVPALVVKKLERAITLRQRCASWFKVSAHGVVSLASNESHQHCIEVLQTALEILKPLCKPASGSGQRKTKPSNNSKGTDQAEQEVKQQNYFEALTLEVVEEEEDLEILLQHGKSDKKAKKHSRAKTTFVPEPQSQKDEFMLGCFCFFQDLQDVRSFLQEIWQKYNDKQVALITAALVNNAALDFIRRAEEEFVETFSQSGDYYDCFIDQMFRQACAVREHPFLAMPDPDASKNLGDYQLYVDEMANEAEWIMLPTWHLLKKCTRSFLEDANKNWSMYTAQLEEGRMVKIWGKYGPDPQYAGKQGQQLFNALILGLAMVTFDRPTDMIGIDSFRAGVVAMMVTKKIPASLVFATQNFLDIHHILKDDISRGLEELQATCSIMRHRVQQHIEVLEPLAALNKWEGEDLDFLKHYRDLFLFDNYEDYQTVFLLNPAEAGLREFFTIGWFQRSGLGRMNSGDVVAAAHLYNVAQLETHFMPWSDMEFIIDTQTPQYVFFGGRPTTLDECCLKVELAVGFSIRNRNPTTFTPKNLIFRRGEGNRYLEVDCLPFTNIFLARGIGSNVRDLGRTVESLELFLNGALHGVDRSQLKLDGTGKIISRVELKRFGNRKPKATLCQLLAVLEKELTQELPVLYFDFCRFRMTCDTLLKGIFERIKSAWYGAIAMEPLEGDEPPPIYMIPFEILAKAKLSILAEPTTGIPHLGSRIINEVATMLEDFTRKNGSTAVNDLQQFASGVVWADFKARFGEPTSHPEDGLSTIRPTLSSMTEGEIEKAHSIGDHVRRMVATSDTPTGPARRGKRGRR